MIGFDKGEYIAGETGSGYEKILSASGDRVLRAALSGLDLAEAFFYPR